MTKTVKLPNGNVVGVSNDGMIAVRIEIETYDLIQNDHEAVLDLMSEKATGSPCMSNIVFGVVGNTGNTLTVVVTGRIDEIEGIEEVDFESLPMAEYEVDVTRVGYGSRTARVLARSAEEAVFLADGEAGNHEYDEHHSEYLFDVRQAQAVAVAA